MPEVQLSFPDFPYRFDLLLEIVRRFAYPARQVVLEDKLYRVTHGQVVSYSATTDYIKIESPTPLSDDIVVTSRHLLGLNNNLTSFYEYAKTDLRLWRTIQPLHGLPVFCTETVFEALITLIIEQHITWKNALRSQQTLMQIFDTSQVIDNITVYDFPSLEQLANATSEQLKPLKITNRRIALIIQVAQMVVDQELDLESIRELDSTSAYQLLLGIKGVGHWTASNVIGRALGIYPYVSHNDVALQAAIQHYFYDDAGKKSAQQVIDTLEPYGEYAGLAGHFTLLRWVLDKYPIAN